MPQAQHSCVAINMPPPNHEVTAQPDAVITKLSEVLKDPAERAKLIKLADQYDKYPLRHFLLKTQQAIGQLSLGLLSYGAFTGMKALFALEDNRDNLQNNDGKPLLEQGQDHLTAYVLNQIISAVFPKKMSEAEQNVYLAVAGMAMAACAAGLLSNVCNGLGDINNKRLLLIKDESSADGEPSNSVSWGAKALFKHVKDRNIEEFQVANKTKIEHAADFVKNISTAFCQGAAAYYLNTTFRQNFNGSAVAQPYHNNIGNVDYVGLGLDASVGTLGIGITHHLIEAIKDVSKIYNAKEWANEGLRNTAIRYMRDQ